MRTYITLVLVLLHTIVFGQQQGRSLIDSLRAELNNIAEDTHRVNILDRLSYTYSRINPDTGIILGRQALELAKQLKWKKGIAVAHADLGANYLAKAQYAAALSHNHAALRIYKKLGSKKSIAAMHANLALIYHAQGNYPKALEYNLKALPIMEELGERQNQSVILENIGTLYVEQKNYSKAETYYSEALQLNKEFNNEAALARNKSNMGIVYDGRGDYGKALEYQQSAYDINSRYGYKNAMQINLANIGLVHHHMDDLDKALQYHMEALRISEEIKNPAAIAINSGNIGAVYTDIAKKQMKINDDVYSAVIADNRNKAIRHIERSVRICNEIGYTAPKIEFMKGLAELYHLAGNHKSAYETQKKYSKLKDSVYTVQAAMQLANLETKREADIHKKNLRITRLEVQQKQNEILLYILSIFALLTILIVAIKRVMLYRKKNRLLDEEKKKNIKTIHDQVLDIALRKRAMEEIAEIQSHDVRGRVTTILGLAQLFNTRNYADPENKVIIDGIISSTSKLDNTLKALIEKKNNLTK